MADIVFGLLGGKHRVKLMRLFIFNPSKSFSLEEIKKRSGLNKERVVEGVRFLEKIKFIKRRVYYVENIIKKGKAKKKKINGFVFNDNFIFAGELQTILMSASPLRSANIIRRFNRAGNIKLLVTAGVFIKNPESRLDLLVVGDRLKRAIIEKTMKSLEGEIGRELHYAVFETADFNYRTSVYDRLLRDVFDYPHQKLVDKIGVKTK